MANHLTTAGQFSVGLFAHQGGWDEVLIVVAPLIAIWLILLVAKKRADAAAESYTATKNPPPVDDE